MNGNISMLVITAWRSGSMQSKYNLHDTGEKKYIDGNRKEFTYKRHMKQRHA